MELRFMDMRPLLLKRDYGMVRHEMVVVTVQNTRGRTHNNKLLQSKKLIYCIKNKNKKLCTEYETSWNDSKKIRELMKKRDAIMQDPLDLLIKSVRES